MDGPGSFSQHTQGDGPNTVTTAGGGAGAGATAGAAGAPAVSQPQALKIEKVLAALMAQGDDSGLPGLVLAVSEEVMREVLAQGVPQVRACELEVHLIP